MPIPEVVDKIHKETGLSKDEIENQIEAKLESLDGLVSREGASYIVASELGVQLFKEINSGEALKIKNLLAGMQSVELVGKVIKTYEPRTFTRAGKENKVGSFLIADETGKMRVVLWDTRADWLTNGKITEGTIVKIKNAYTKDNAYTGVELHLGQRSILMLDPTDVEVNVTIQTGENQKKICDMNAGEEISAIATIVQAWAPNFFEACKQCGKKNCTTHNEIEPAMVMNFVLDDGTDTIRSVAFRNKAEQILGMSTSEAQEIEQSEGKEALQDKITATLIGKIIEVEGRVVENTNFERLELQVNNTNTNPNAKAIAEQLLNKK